MSELMLRTAFIARDMLRAVSSRVRDERGQDAIEYVGVLVVVAAIIVVMTTVASGLTDTLKNDVTNAINNIFASGGKH